MNVVEDSPGARVRPVPRHRHRRLTRLALYNIEDAQHNLRRAALVSHFQELHISFVSADKVAYTFLDMFFGEHHCMLGNTDVIEAAKWVEHECCVSGHDIRFSYLRLYQLERILKGRCLTSGCLTSVGSLEAHWVRDEYGMDTRCLYTQMGGGLGRGGSMSM